MKLAHLIAKLDQIKKRSEEQITEIYKSLQKPNLFLGGIKKYLPFDESKAAESEKPVELTKVQLKAMDLLANFQSALGEAIDGTYQQDKANCVAAADIVVEGNVLAKQVPVTNLLYLHKAIDKVIATLEHTPTPDQSIDWVTDSNTGLLKSKDTVITQRSAKVMKVLVKYEATKEHPAQTETYTVDEPVGEYHSVKYSGCVPFTQVQSMLKRAHLLRDAIKVAREEANMNTQVPDERISKDLLGYIFEPQQA